MNTRIRGAWISMSTASAVAPVPEVKPAASPPPVIVPKPPHGRKRHLILAAVIVVGILAGLWAWQARRRERGAAAGSVTASTAKVERRTFQRTLRLSGTIEAVRSYSVLAPRLTGGDYGQMVLTKLTRGGTRVKKGDLLAELDREAQLKNYLDKQAEFRDLQNQIDSKKGEQAAARAHDDTELKQAEDAVGTARLEVQRNEVVSRIDAEKNKLDLEAAAASLKQLRQTYDLKRKAAAADLRLLEIKRDRAQSAMTHAQQNAEKMTLLSPLEGLVVLNPIWKGGGMGEVEEGDQIWTGFSFMQVVDPSTMQVRVRVNQLDVPYLKIGQDAEIHLDAYPDLKLPGKLERLAAIGLSGGLSRTVRGFGALFSMAGSDPRLMPDLSASIDVVLSRQPDALVVPREAVVRQDGKSWVYVKHALGVEKRAVETGDEDDLEVVVLSGLEPQMEVERHPRAGG
jgi:multidrug efflux pump subunit AcrA (membrane-fusion protein)